MILDQKKTTLAYRCPACGGVPTSMVGAFSLSGNLFKLKCTCGESSLTVEKTNEDKIRLTVPCLVCPSPHTYLLSKNVFFGSDIFVIPCSVCGIDICFIGKENEVSSAVKRSNDEIIRILGDASLEELKSIKDNELSDPMLFDVITYVISDLYEEGKIYCNCNDGCGEYTSEILNSSVLVKCKKCGACVEIPVGSTQGAQDFLEATELRLK